MKFNVLNVGEEVTILKKIDDNELYDIIAVKYKIVRLDFFINQKEMCCKIEFELSDDKYKKEYEIQEHTSDFYFEFYCYFDEKGNSETVTNDLSYYVRPACINYKPINLFLTLQEAEKGIPLYRESIIHALEKSEKEEQKEKQIKVEIKEESFNEYK